MEEKKITITMLRRRPYGGTDYKATGLEGMSKEEALEALGLATAWWVSGFYITDTGVAYWNENFD